MVCVHVGPRTVHSRGITCILSCVKQALKFQNPNTDLEHVKIPTLITDLLVKKGLFHWPILFRYLFHWPTIQTYPFHWPTIERRNAPFSLIFQNWPFTTFHNFTKCNRFILCNNKYLIYEHMFIWYICHTLNSELCRRKKYTLFSKITWYCYPKRSPHGPWQCAKTYPFPWIFASGW